MASEFAAGNYRFIPAVFQYSSGAQANEAIGYIRRIVRELFGDSVAGAMRIQYGGSVKPTNIGELMAQPDIDGALVGGASLDPDEFALIVRYQG